MATGSRVAAKAAEVSAKKGVAKGASKLIPGVGTAVSAGFVASDLAHGKKGSALVDGLAMAGTPGAIASIGLSAVGVDKMADKVLSPNSVKASKYPGDPKLNKEGMKEKAAGKDKFSVGKKLLDGYKKLGKGGMATTLAIAAMLFGGLSKVLGLDNQKTQEAQAGPQL